MERIQINQLQTFANSDSDAVSNPHVWPTFRTCSFFASFGHSLRFQPHPLLSGLCIWPWYFECERPVCPSDSPCHVNCCAHKQNHQLWLEQSGHFTRGLKCIQLSFQSLSIHLKPPGSLTRRQALNVHFKTAPFRKDVELLWFAQTYYECGSLHRIYIWISRGLRGVHSDTSAASIWKLRQWRSQLPSCLDYVVLDDRSPVIDCPPCVRKTKSKDDMICRIKVRLLVWARLLWFQTLFYQTVLQEHCKAKTIMFSHQNPPMSIFFTTFAHHHSR